MVIGPAILVAAAMVMSLVLPSLPRVKPPKSLSNVQPVELNAEVKLVLVGSIVKLPGPLKPLLAELGASPRRINAPASILVAPV